MHCAVLSMVWESCEKRVTIEKALRAPKLKPTPWYMVPRVYTCPDLCLFHEAASPEVKGRFIGKSDWQVVQKLVAPMWLGCHGTRSRQAANQYSRDDPALWVQPFDMPMAHVEIPSTKCSPTDTEVVVFFPRKGEPNSSMWPAEVLEQ